MNTKIFRTLSENETYNLGENIAKELKGGEVLALYGELGSGKTTFTKGLAKGLGIVQQITSPTFLLVKQYSNVNHPLIRTLYHLDLYRIQSETDLRSIGFKDMFKNPHALTVIEWAEKMGDFLPKKRIDVTFEHLDENERRITLRSY